LALYKQFIKIMKKSEIGILGEQNACNFLIKRGYQIMERNYRKKFGEIDIIVRAPDLTLVFIEVKTLLIKNQDRGFGFSPEDNFTTHKFSKVKRMCEFFAAQHGGLVNEEVGWRVDLIAVDLFEDGKCSIRHYENV